MKRLRFMVIVALIVAGGSASACRFNTNGDGLKEKRQVRAALSSGTHQTSSQQTTKASK